MAQLNKNLQVVTEKNEEFEKMHSVWKVFMENLQKIPLHNDRGSE
jgi:hypothetical protein